MSGNNNDANRILLQTDELMKASHANAQRDARKLGRARRGEVIAFWALLALIGWVALAVIARAIL